MTDTTLFGGRYVVGELLGSGGMGIVYRAWDNLLQRDVALKIPKIDDDDDGVARERFQREAAAVRQLHHPGICGLIDVGEADGQPYMTMPIVDGTSLRDLMVPGQAWEPLRAVALVGHLTDALEHAHAHDIFHRDLKPSNILVTAGDLPVVIDFGLVKRLRAQQLDLTNPNQILGTPMYMAPEQIDATRGRIGPHTDVYALGVILYQLLTGKLPFDGTGTAPLLMARIVSDEVPKPPRALRPRLSPRLNDICVQAIAKRPKARFTSMSAFKRAINDYLYRHTDPPHRHETPRSNVAPVLPPPPPRPPVGAVVLLLLLVLLPVLVYFVAAVADSLKVANP